MIKRQPDTAIASYRDVSQTLGERQRLVRELLTECRDRYGCWPTSLELLRYAVATREQCRRFDVNAIRPRLFELHEQGYVVHGVKRTCTVSGKRVYTWIATTPQPPQYGDFAQARQVEMF